MLTKLVGGSYSLNSATERGVEKEIRSSGVFMSELSRKLCFLGSEEQLAVLGRVAGYSLTDFIELCDLNRVEPKVVNAVVAVVAYLKSKKMA